MLPVKVADKTDSLIDESVKIFLSSRQFGK